MGINTFFQRDGLGAGKLEARNMPVNRVESNQALHIRRPAGDHFIRQNALLDGVFNVQVLSFRYTTNNGYFLLKFS
jgi:hypothetical protein